LDRLEKFWEELKKRNVVRAFIFYVVAAWLIIQFATATFPYLNFPPWAIQAVIITLLIGAPIVLIISWIYELTTDGLRKTGSIDREKSISVKTGKKLNRLTIVILSLAVVFLLIDKFYLSAPVEAETQKTESIAVFPFSIQGGKDIQYLREGMVDLISTKLDGIPGMNATDPNILLTRLEGRNVNSRDPKSAAALAQELGANRVILGSVTQLGDELQVKLSKYDNNGEAIGATIVEHGSEKELYGKVDDVIRRLVSEELVEKGSTFESEAVLTTNKIESIVPYLNGLQLRRKGQFKEAAIAFGEAIAEDTTFALGYWAFLENDGWTKQLEPEVFWQYVKKMEVLVESLTGKNKEFILAGLAQDNADISAIEKFQGLLDKYGESREILNGLAESIYHFSAMTGSSVAKATPYFDRLIEIDPTNSEYLKHRLDIARREGNLIDFQKYSALFDSQADDKSERNWQEILLMDSVSDEVLQQFITHASINELPFTPAYGPKAMSNLKLMGRLMAMSPELNERHKLDYDEAFMSLKGQHTDLIQRYVDTQETQRGNNYYGTWMFLTGYPGNPNFVEFDKEAIETLEFLINNPQTEWLYANQYLLSLLYLNTGDYVKADSVLLTFRKKFDASEPEPTYGTKEEYKLMYYSLAGMREFLSGNYEQTELYFDSAVYQVKSVPLALAEGFSLTRYTYLAEALSGLNRPEEALVVYENMMSIYSSIDYIGLGANWGFMMYRIAQLHDELGHKEQAIGYYNVFTEAFQEADEKYQDWVDNAYARLSVLVEKPEEELRGRITNSDN